MRIPVTLAILAYALFLLPGTAQSRGRLYWGQIINGRIYSAKLDGSAKEIILTESASPWPAPRNMYFDASSQLLHWVQWNGNSGGPYGNFGRIRRGTGCSSSVTNLTNTWHATGIDVDPVDGYIYWTDNNETPGTGRVMRCDLDGSNVVSLLTGLRAPAGIVVDQPNSTLFYTDVNLAEIHSAGLDGTGDTIIRSGVTGFSMDIDAANGHLYFTVHYGLPNYVARMDCDGNNLVGLVPGFTNDTRGVCLDLNDGHVYWTILHQGVFRADLDGSNATTIVAPDVGAGLDNFWGITLAPPGFFCTGVLYDLMIEYPDNGGVDPGNRSKDVGQWVTTRVTALDGGGAPLTGYTGTVTLSANGESPGAEVDWALASGNGVFVDGGPGDDTATYTFDPADNGVADFQIKDDTQDFIDPEVTDGGAAGIMDDDTEEYIVFTQPNNIPEGSPGNVLYGGAIAAFSTSIPTPLWLTQISYARVSGGYLADPTATVVPYKDTAALGVTPPPNFKLLYGGVALDAPYPYCNGYDISFPSYPPTPPPVLMIIAQSFDDAVLSDVDEGNIQMHHWNGSSWDLLPATVDTGNNLIWVDATGLPSLSPLFITEPLPENVDTATVAIDPDTLNLAGTWGWVHAYIELGGGLDVNDIDLSTVTINPTEIDVSPDTAGVALADTGYVVIGDYDNDTTPDADVRFDRAKVVAMMSGANPSEEFMVRGFMNDGFTFFKGYTTITTIDDILSATPPDATELALGQNYPNPFNPNTTIPFVLSESGHVSLVVYDVEGKRVKVLVDAQRPAGAQQAVWRGTDDSGIPVATGIYFYRLKTGSQVLTRKMVLLK